MEDHILRAFLAENTANDLPHRQFLPAHTVPTNQTVTSTFRGTNDLPTRLRNQSSAARNAVHPIHWSIV